MYIVIVGCGRLGSTLATRLSKEGHDVAIVDRNPDNFGRLSDEFNGTTVPGVGFDSDVLRSAGIEHADGFAAVTEGDNMNIMAAQVAKNIFKVPMVIARDLTLSREKRTGPWDLTQSVRPHQLRTSSTVSSSFAMRTCTLSCREITSNWWKFPTARASWREL